MRYMLIALIGFLTLYMVFAFDPGPAPGLNIKNAMLYVIMLTLLLRVSIDRRYRIQMPSIPVVFIVLITYAVLSYGAVVLVVHYPRYDWLNNGIYLKNSLFDQMMFFLVFFYGLRSDEEAVQVLKVVLLCWVLSHVMAVLGAVGIAHFGRIEQDEEGRVQGLVGEPNQYGAFVALTVPAVASVIMITRGFWRLFWIAATGISALTLLMTVSRGAFVGTVFAIAVGLYMFRRYVPTGKLLTFVGSFVAAAGVVMGAAAALGFGGLIVKRMMGGARVGADIEGVSSGRTQIWLHALEVMWEKPLTLLTGYGWQMYPAMPFRLATHNHYLASWFNLGVVGLTCAVLLLVLPIRYARRAAPIASNTTRPLLIGFVIGALALSASVFFVDLYMPWHYFWAYTGVIMRLAVNAVEGEVTGLAPVAASAPPPPRPRRDPHGWTTAR
ncbi:MAG TPA: O-antigen ligase family protein [Steroidobacteraceae bacterium]|nr:O-antigen ligase family protein [Steroidobacteraceae bacterium]